MIKLYDFPLSGHSHRVRTMLSILSLDYELIPVDLQAGEHKSEAFLALNPLGQVPVLVDDDLVLRDSNAIISYLARQYDESWYPTDAVSAGHIQEWLATANKEINAGPGAARLVNVFGADLDHPKLIEQSHVLLSVIDKHLADRKWLAIETPSIADIAAYTYIAHAPEGDVSLDAYIHINTWIKRVESLSGFVAMPATPIHNAA